MSSAMKRSKLSLKRKPSSQLKKDAVNGPQLSEEIQQCTESTAHDVASHCCLANLGNTCYINVMVQVLKSCSSNLLLTESICPGVIKKPPINQDGHVCQVLLELLRSMFAASSDDQLCMGVPVIKPLELVKVIQSKTVLFEQYVQHDTLELFNYLLSSLKHTATVDHSEPGSTSTDNAGRQKITDFFKSTTSTQKQTAVSNTGNSSCCVDIVADHGMVTLAKSCYELFEGMLQFETRCLCCEDTSTQSESFFNISVPVFSSELTRRCGPVSLYTAINKATTLNALTSENKYWCSNCHHLTEGRRNAVIETLPQIVTIHLNRFITDTTGMVQVHKALGNIAMPVTICFKQWCSPSCQYKDDVYKLHAVVLHTGSSCRSGHYTVVINTIRQSDGNNQHNWMWALFDDDKVTNMSHDQMLDILSPLSNNDSTPYILFYERYR